MCGTAVRCTFKYYNLQQSYREDSATTSSTTIYRTEDTTRYNAWPSVRLHVGTREENRNQIPPCPEEPHYRYFINNWDSACTLHLTSDIDRATQDKKNKTRLAIHPRPFPRQAVPTPMLTAHPSLITTAADAHAPLFTSVAPRLLKNTQNKARQPFTSKYLFGFHDIPYERPPYRVLVASALPSVVAISSTPCLRQPNESEIHYY